MVLASLIGFFAAFSVWVSRQLLETDRGDRPGVPRAREALEGGDPLLAARGRGRWRRGLLAPRPGADPAEFEREKALVIGNG
jgi:hypothetical protein